MIGSCLFNDISTGNVIITLIIFFGFLESGVTNK